MKTRILINEGEYRLTKAGVMDAHIDAEELYCFLKGCDKVVLFLMKEEEADKETEDAYWYIGEKHNLCFKKNSLGFFGIQPGFDKFDRELSSQDYFP